MVPPLLFLGSAGFGQAKRPWPSGEGRGPPHRATQLDRAVSSAAPAGRTTPVELGCLASSRVRHVADLQEQAASPSDLQIDPDFPVGKQDQTKQTR
jgi:hypothetical protein